MYFKKIVSFAAIVGQMTLASGLANADMGTAAQAPTQEKVLLEQVAALQGQNLSKKEYKSAVHADIAAYNSSAPAEGRPERIKQALVDDNFMTADRADQFVATINSELSSAQNTQDLNTKQVQAMVAHSVYNGAQLSSCNLDQGLGILLVAGGIISIPFIAHFGTRDMSTYARNWTYVGASVAIVTGVAMLALNRTCN